MKKVVIFTRVSSNQQDLEPQIKAVEKEALHDGYKKNELIYVSGKESAIKKKEYERETLKELNLILDKNQTIESVYFFSVDRLARRVEVILSVCEKMSERGINLVFLNPNKFSTLSKNEQGQMTINPMGQLLLSFLAFGASLEMTVKKERFYAARASMKRNGQLQVSNTPYGYYRGKDGYVHINEEEAAIVRRIFNSYASEGTTLQSIGRQLVQEGIWSTDAKLGETKRTISRIGLYKRVAKIVLNDCYSGWTSPTNVTYPSIVDKELQERCKQKASDRTRKKADTKHVFFGKGLVKIQIGDKYFQMWPTVGDVAYKAFDTTLAFQPTKQLNINANVVDFVLWSEASHHYKLQQLRNQATAPIELENFLKIERSKLIEIEGNIAKYDEAKERAGRSFALGMMSEKSLISLREELKDKCEPWITRLATCKTEIERLERLLEEAKNPSINFITQDLSTLGDEAKKEIVKKMVNELLITKEEKYVYILSPHMNTAFPTRTWKYNSSGGVKRLYFLDTDGSWTDCSMLVVERFHNPRNKH